MLEAAYAQVTRRPTPPVVIDLWCNAVPGVCPRCGAACCSGEQGEPGDPFFCAGRCDSQGHHDDGSGEVYNNEPCWHA